MSTRVPKQLKPRVFVGSSGSAGEIVEAFVNELRRDADVVPWWEAAEFKPMTSILTGLLNAVDKGVSAYDFGLFILAADDVVISKGKRSNTPRDNVIFELGLFLGTYGHDRTFAVIQEGEEPSQEVKKMSDLGGIIIPSFSAGNKKTLRDGVRKAAAPIRELIKEKGRIRLGDRLRDWENYVGWDFDRGSKQFRIDIEREFFSKYENVLEGKKLLLIAYKEDTSKNLEDRKDIAVSAPRSVPRLPGDMTLLAPETNRRKNLFSDIGKGAKLQGRVFLIPNSLAVQPGMTINDYLNAGAEFAFGGET
jgi:predicted nucleotide-binding protein